MLALRAALAFAVGTIVAQAAVYPRAGACVSTDRGFIDGGNVCQPCGVNNRANGDATNCSPCFVGAQLSSSATLQQPFAGGSGCGCNTDKGLFANPLPGTGPAFEAKCRMCSQLGRFNGAGVSNVCGKCKVEGSIIDAKTGACLTPAQIVTKCADAATRAVSGSRVNVFSKRAGNTDPDIIKTQPGFYVPYAAGTDASKCCEQCTKTPGCVGWVFPQGSNREFSTTDSCTLAVQPNVPAGNLADYTACGADYGPVTLQNIAGADYYLGDGPCGTLV